MKKKVTKTKQTDKKLHAQKIKSKVQDKHYFFFPREYLWTEQKCFWGHGPMCSFFFFLSACFLCLKLDIHIVYNRDDPQRSSMKVCSKFSLVSTSGLKLSPI